MTSIRHSRSGFNLPSRPQYLAGRDGSFLPGGMFVRQFLALIIEFDAVMINVEKIPRHEG